MHAPEVYSAIDYYPFGMEMPKRSLSATAYRFGYNGQMKDNEYTGQDGAHEEFKYREYDSRIGRFWSVDPLFKDYPWNSTYAFAENRPIDGRDLEGKEWQYFSNNFKSFEGRIILRLANVTSVGKEYLQALLSQNKFDVYFYDINAPYAQTIKITSLKDFEKSTYSRYAKDKVDMSIVKKVLSSGKSLILIGINSNQGRLKGFLQSRDMGISNESYESGIIAPLKEESFDLTDEYIHALNVLKGLVLRQFIYET